METSTLKKHNSGFTITPNNIINNEKLSFKAKGIYTFLSSKPDGWNFSTKRMAQQSKDGIDSIRAGLNELISSKYLKRQRLSNGRIVYELFNYPNCEIDNQPNLHKATEGKSHDGKTPPISNKELLVIKSNSNTNTLQSSDCDKKEPNEVNLLLNEFKEINPMINFGNKTQRKALEELLSKFGYDKVKGSIDYLKTVIADKYAPVITTPLDLKNKIDKLSAYYLKNKQKTTPIF